MDLNQAIELAKAVYAGLQPYLPALASGVATGVGRKVPDAIVALYARVKDRLSSDASSTEALDGLLAQPDDVDLQAAFRVQVKKQLLSDAAFAADIERLLKDPSIQNVTQSGSSNVANQGSGNATSQTMTNSPGGMQAARDININTNRRLTHDSARRIQRALSTAQCPLSIGVLGLGGEPSEFADNLLRTCQIAMASTRGVNHGVGLPSFTGVQIRYSPVSTP